MGGVVSDIIWPEAVEAYQRSAKRPKYYGGFTVVYKARADAAIDSLKGFFIDLYDSYCQECDVRAEQVKKWEWVARDIAGTYCGPYSDYLDVGEEGAVREALERYDSRG
jgi:hypothetical protein